MASVDSPSSPKYGRRLTTAFISVRTKGYDFVVALAEGLGLTVLDVRFGRIALHVGAVVSPFRSETP